MSQETNPILIAEATKMRALIDQFLMELKTINDDADENLPKMIVKLKRKHSRSPVLFVSGYNICYSTLYGCKVKTGVSVPFLSNLHQEILREFLTNEIKPNFQHGLHEDNDILSLKLFYQSNIDYQTLSSYLNFIFEFRKTLDHNHQNNREMESAQKEKRPPRFVLQPLSEITQNLFKEVAFDEEMKASWSMKLRGILQLAETVDYPHVDWGLIFSCVETFKGLIIDEGGGAADDSLLGGDEFRACLCMASANQSAQLLHQVNMSSDIVTYLQHASTFVDTVSMQLSRYLSDAKEVDALAELVVNEVLHKRQTELFGDDQSGPLAQLLQNEEFEVMQEVACLLSKGTGLLVVVNNTVGTYFRNLVNERMETWQHRLQGRKRNRIESGAVVEMYRDLFKLHQKFSYIFEEHLKSHWTFRDLCKHAFSQLKDNYMDEEEEPENNFSQPLNGETMASVYNQLLTAEGSSGNDVQLDLDMMVQLSAYLLEKDVFIEMYRHHMAKRLHRVGSQALTVLENEVLVVEKLSEKYGAQFTSKLKGMLTDLTLSFDQNTEFKAYFNTLPEASSSSCQLVDFNAQVLTKVNWPSPYTLNDEICLPPQMRHCYTVFQDYYLAKNNSTRKLQWVWSLGHATVRGVFEENSYDFELTTLQTIVLLAFNQNDGLMSFWTIREKVNLSEDVLKRVLHSFACNKTKAILLKEPASSSIKQTDSFNVNINFSSKKKRIHVPMPTLTTATKTNKPVVYERRQCNVDASLVRIIKARKSISHQDLVSEVLTQTQFFQPTPKFIKSRIESLIEREYLERDSDKPDLYTFVA